MATSGVVPLPLLNWDATNPNDAFVEWKDFLTSYFVINDVAEDKKWHYILLSAGQRGHELWKTWSLTDAQRANPEVVFKKFEDHLVGTVNKWVMRLELSNMQQADGESIDDFVCRLRAKASQCKFADDASRDEMITFQLIKGVKWAEEKKALIKKGNGLKLDAAIESARCYQAALQNTNSFTKSASDCTVSVNKVNSRDRQSKLIRNCYYCGRDHPRRQCPAYGTTCESCGEQNHWRSQCEIATQHHKRGHSRQRKPQAVSKSQAAPKNACAQGKRKGKQNVRHVSDNCDSEADDESLCIQSIVKVRQISNEQLQAKLHVHHSKAKLITQIDTGAEANILPKRCFNKLYPDGHQPILDPKPSSTLANYDGTRIYHHGMLTLSCSANAKDWYDIDFFVCDSQGPIILGLKDSRRLELINPGPFAKTTVSVVCNADNSHVKRQRIMDSQDLIAMYPDRFSGLGRFPREVKLELKDDTVPVVHAPRRCPVHLKDDIEKALAKMEAAGVIKKIPSGQPTEWLSSLAYARKPNGKLRVCLDPRDLNVNLKRTYHRAMTVEEITHKLSGARYLSKLDAKDGYWSMVLDEKSSLLTAFNSPASNQRYMFRRLPFGLCVAQDLFQEAMDECTRDLNGVISIADDICVFGGTEQEHDENLHGLMKKARAYGLVFNADKCAIKTDEIAFFGAVYTKDGVKPDPKRVAEIQELPPPDTKTKVLSFLGMAQYLSAHIPHLSEITAPLRGLTKKDTDFRWTGTHQKCFDDIKQAIASATTLHYFNPQYQTKIQVDASKVGLGAALIQVDPDEPNRERVVAFASKSLSQVETRYANIERECLAVVFGVEKFHTYVYGSSVVVESDHKPLESICQKNLAQAPPRLQRMLLRLQPYDICVKYRKGTELQLADFLSRYKPNVSGGHIEMEQTIHSVRWSNDKIQSLKRATAEDEKLSMLLDIVRQGWPTDCRDLPKSLRIYWSLRDYISIDNGILTKGQQIIIPEILRQDILSQLHNHSHQGIEKTQLLARKSVYWPGINSDIANTVGQCHICNTYRNSLPAEPMHQRELPSGPWEVLGSDLFDFDGEKFLLLCDYYSKFFMIRKLSNESSSSVIRHLKLIFSEQGIPSELCSDNGPCYNSREFKHFAATYGFKHTTSSPHYPQSNGFAERMVGTVKRTMRKCQAAGEDYELAFLFLRTTPIAGNLPSPAELLYGRPIRSMLPSTQLFDPSDEKNKELMKQRQDVQKHYFDKGTHELPPLTPGEPVMLQSHQDLKWRPATVVMPTEEPRSYIIQDTDGTRYRRNRRFLRRLPPGPSSAAHVPDSMTVENGMTRDSTAADKHVSVNDTPAVATFDADDPVTHIKPHRDRRPPKRLIEEM